MIYFISEVLIDELGRATSTIDGISLGWSVLEALLVQRCVCFFASHNHDLHHLMYQYKSIATKQMASSHQIQTCSNKDINYTYGIEYAAKIGLPASVIQLATEFRDKHSSSSFWCVATDENGGSGTNSPKKEDNKCKGSKEKNDGFHTFSRYCDLILKETSEGDIFKARVVNKEDVCKKLQAIKMHCEGSSIANAAKEK